MLGVVLKRFEQPDEVRTFEKGKFELVRLGGMTIGRATYQPGWKWSLHVGPSVGHRAAMSSTWGWCSQAVPRQRWMTARSTNSAPACSFASRPGPRDMIAGWWVTNRTFSCTSLARSITQPGNSFQAIGKDAAEGHFRRGSGWVARYQRRTATTDQIASTTPKGHAPCRNP